MMMMVMNKEKSIEKGIMKVRVSDHNKLNGKL